MAAIVVNLNNFGTRTPEQVVRIFYTLYTPEAIETALWNVFRICALAEEKENPGHQQSITAIASLFDQLIAFTRAIHQLRAAPPGKCIICNREPTGDSS